MCSGIPTVGPAATRLKGMKCDDLEVDDRIDTNIAVRIDRLVHKIKSFEDVKDREGNKRSNEKKSV
jgi:hypothetical protein